MEDEDVNVVVDAPPSAPHAPVGAAHAPAAPDADRETEAAEPEETVPPPPRPAENNK